LAVEGFTFTVAAGVSPVGVELPCFLKHMVSFMGYGGHHRVVVEPHIY
jgi:hypothetical protein